MSRKKNRNKSKRNSARGHKENLCTRYETHYVKKDKKGRVLDILSPPSEPTKIVEALMAKVHDNVLANPSPDKAKPIPDNVREINSHPKFKTVGKSTDDELKSMILQAEEELLLREEKRKKDLMDKELLALRSMGVQRKLDKIKDSGDSDKYLAVRTLNKGLSASYDTFVDQRNMRKVEHLYAIMPTQLETFWKKFNHVNRDTWGTYGPSSRSDVSDWSDMIHKHTGVLNHKYYQLTKKYGPSFLDYQNKIYEHLHGGYAKALEATNDDVYKPEQSAAHEPSAAKSYGYGFATRAPKVTTSLTPSGLPISEFVTGKYAPSLPLFTPIVNDINWILKNVEPDKWPKGLAELVWNEKGNPASKDYVNTNLSEENKKLKEELYQLKCEHAKLQDRTSKFNLDNYTNAHTRNAIKGMSARLSQLIEENNKLKQANAVMDKLLSNTTTPPIFRQSPKNMESLANEYKLFCTQFRDNPTKAFVNWTYGPKEDNALKDYFNSLAKARMEGEKLRTIGRKQSLKIHTANVRKEIMALHRMRENIKRKCIQARPLLINNQLAVGKLDSELAVYQKWSIDYEQRRSNWFENQIQTRILPAYKAMRKFQYEKRKAEYMRNKLIEQDKIKRNKDNDLAAKIAKGINTIKDILNKEVYISPSEKKRRTDKAVAKLERKQRKAEIRERKKLEKEKREELARVKQQIRKAQRVIC